MERPRFGPAGVPPSFRFKSGTLGDVPSLLVQEGLDALEYEAVRWGKKPQIRKEEAVELAEQAAKNDVWLSVHGSYFINFAGQKVIIEASKQRLLACVTAASWMRAHTAVFHAGSYGRHPSELALQICLESLKGSVALMDQNGISNVNIGPETMGKIHQLGSLEEVITICENVEHTQPVLDWSHLHARGLGRFRSEDDFGKVFDQIEQRLGTQAIKTLHCHFTKIEYTEKGEREHHVLREERFGPDFRLLAKVIIDRGLTPILICESPLLDLDAIYMREIYSTLQSKN